MNRHVPLTVLVLSLAFGTGDIAFSRHAQQQTAAEIIAAQVRKQGYTCGKAESAERDTSRHRSHTCRSGSSGATTHAIACASSRAWPTRSNVWINNRGRAASDTSFARLNN